MRVARARLRPGMRARTYGRARHRSGDGQDPQALPGRIYARTHARARPRLHAGQDLGALPGRRPRRSGDQRRRGAAGGLAAGCFAHATNSATLAGKGLVGAQIGPRARAGRRGGLERQDRPALVVVVQQEDRKRLPVVKRLELLHDVLGLDKHGLVLLIVTVSGALLPRGLQLVQECRPGAPRGVPLCLLGQVDLLLEVPDQHHPRRPALPESEEPRPKHADAVREEVPRGNLPGVGVLDLHERVDDDGKEEVHENPDAEQHERPGVDPVDEDHLRVEVLLHLVDLDEVPVEHLHLRLQGLTHGAQGLKVRPQDPVRNERKHAEEGHEEHQEVPDVVQGPLDGGRQYGHLGVRVEVEDQLQELDVADDVGRDAVAVQPLCLLPDDRLRVEVVLDARFEALIGDATQV
mmetsp:Transcript_20818/g.65069  ORF Transcript_20818/g.65069 Transcript_20818/m.65069 type:complete len:407 (-) Transcript_20818:1061-2281(-)